MVPLRDEEGKVIAAKILVYPGDREEYITHLIHENQLKLGIVD
jgi:hypothetical protein